jgi:sucrose-6-phosphate hydrolase SacC (GH32 family)
MSYHWRKRGLIFRPTGQHGWINSHAQVPTAFYYDRDGIVRVYFATRPKPGLSLTTFVDLDSNDLSRQLFLHDQPILPLGDTGMFDEHGIMPSSVVHHDGAVFLYYSGWSRGTTLPYANFTGLAVSEDGGTTFKKVGPGPILDRTFWGPYSATSPHVLKVDNSWYMFYCSGTGWLDVNGKLEHVYDLKIARSHDGINWEQSSKAVIPQRSPEEAITRPTIFFDGSTYHMWFCFRGSRQFRGGQDSYSIGYAFSSDLLSWVRTDERVGLSCGPEEWNSQMLAYPDASLIDNNLCIFLNGNNFGRDGFGVATCSQSFHLGKK